VHACIDFCIHIHVYIYMYIYIHTHAHTRTNTHTRTRTHTHTYTHQERTWTRAWKIWAFYFSVLSRARSHDDVLHCVAVYCSVLQRVITGQVTSDLMCAITQFSFLTWQSVRICIFMMNWFRLSTYQIVYPCKCIYRWLYVGKYAY